MRYLLMNTLFTLLGFLVLTGQGHSQDQPVELADTIVVTAERTPTTYSELSRTVTVLGPKEIAAAPTSSILDLLSYAPGVEVRRMGNNGVRADISVRGGTFGQTLILVNGVKVTDPQTGHHNLDLPFDLADVERIEIVRGSGSKLYGPNAMSGVINVITKRPFSTGVHVQSVQGGHSLSEQLLSATLLTGRVGHRISVARRTSGGYLNNTEFNLMNLAYGSTLRTGRGPVNVSFGYAEREFGAYLLYSDAYPDEWEATSTLFASADARLLVGRGLISPKLYWRRHEDDFVLDRLRPDWYRNRHTTDQYGVEIQVALPTSLGETVLGGEYGTDKIVSTNLADQDRNRAGLFLEQRLSPLENLSVVPGVAVNWHQRYGWNAWPGIDLGYRLNDRSRVYLTLNRAYRIPDYTELYYVDPGNVGSSQLLPEKAVSVELGARWASGRMNLAGAVFVQRGTNQIDWARRPGETTWLVQNVDRVTTSGLELQFGLRAPVDWSWLRIPKTGIQYAYLDTDRSASAFEYKYLLEHLRHQVIFSLDFKWFDRLDHHWVVRYARRMLGGEYTVVDTKLALPHRYGTVFAELTNLFDEPYSEVRHIPMPGRWLRVGLTLDIYRR